MRRRDRGAVRMCLLFAALTAGTVHGTTGSAKVVPMNETIPSVEKSAETVKEREILPVAYDPRTEGYISPARDQGDWGTCWAHTAAAIAEYSLARKGLADADTVDLSERHMAYFMYHTPQDPLGNAVGDSVYLDDPSNYMDAGGHLGYALFTLANWVGFADEDLAPYGTDRTVPPEDLEESLAFCDLAHLENAYRLAPTDTEEIKTLLMNEGGAFISLNIGEFDAHYNPDTAAFFNPQETGELHSGMVVGWDDTYAADNFLEKCRPSSDGAWLVQNSWGESFGEDGYYWISYEDLAVSESEFIFMDVAGADDYEHNYHYDGSAYSNKMFLKSGSKIANVYTAKASETGAEAVEAVSYAVNSTNVHYAIHIYKNLTDGKDPESGQNMSVIPQTGTIPYSGYYTIPLEHPVTVAEGETFSIVITLSKSSGESVSCDIDDTDDEGAIHYATQELPGQSFYREPGDKLWTDAASAQCTMRIKGFTSDITPVSATSISLAETSQTMQIGEKRKLIVRFNPENATDMRLNFRSSDKTVAEVAADGTVTALRSGTCTITAESAGGLTASCRVTVQGRKPNPWKLDCAQVTLRPGESLLLRVLGATGSVAWSSSRPKVASVSADGRVTAQKQGTTVVTAVLGGQRQSCTVTVKTTLTLSKYSLTVKRKKSKTVTIKLNQGRKVKVNIQNKKAISCTVGKMKNKTCSLTIKGKKKGKAVVTVTNRSTGEKRKLNVKVK